MKKIALGFLALLLTTLVCAQNNTLPTSGNVGVGTLTPETTLHVNGNLKIDSCIIVSDSIIVEKDAHIGQDLKVEGNLIMPSVVDIGTDDSKFMVLDDQGQVKSLNKSNLYADAIDEFYKEECIGKYTTDGTNTDFTAPAWKAEGFVTSPLVFCILVQHVLPM
jgi:hypothetical protein